VGAWAQLGRALESFAGGGGWTFAVFLVLAVFVTAFFRDPFREIPQGPRLVVSPADGKVVMIVPVPAGHPAGEGSTQISIFLSVFDVHINRAPIAGRITDVV